MVPYDDTGDYIKDLAEYNATAPRLGYQCFVNGVNPDAEVLTNNAGTEELTTNAGEALTDY